MSQAVPAAAGRPSAAGVLRQGFRFQDLFILSAALDLLRPNSPYERIEVEANGVGNLDDVILRSVTGDHRYGQVKWSSRPALALDEDYLLFRMGNGTSILQKLYRGWGKVTDASASPRLRLITNRNLDSAHPLLGQVDGRDDRLMPFAGDQPAGSDAGVAVQKWADHLGATRDELLAMLDHLRFETGKTVSSQLEIVELGLLTAGYDNSERAVSLAVIAAGNWVIAGERELTRADVIETLDGLGLRRRAPSAVLSVQAIDVDPHADEADEVLSWMQHYDGEVPRQRVVPREQSAWAVMAGQLDDAAARLEERGFTSTLVRGSMRQATFFRVGTALPHTRQHELLYMQGQQTWATSAPKTIAQVHTAVREVGDGNEIGVVVGVTLDPTDEVERFISQACLPIGRLLTITPARGSDDQSVTSPGHAVALAEAIRNAARAAVSETEAVKVHLFLSGPGGLALLLGHRWNRVAPTQIYEHRGAGRGYVPAFDVVG